MSKTLPTAFALNSAVSFKAGPSQVVRSGTVVGHEGQFVLVQVGDKQMKTRPGAILA